MTHPLTDEICEEITFWRNPCDNMRNAADWQLERDAEFFKKILVDSLRISTSTAALMAQEFKKAMRPQQQEDNPRKFSELTKDISPERRERIEQRKSELRPQEES
jgi:hypothetical protein